MLVEVNGPEAVYSIIRSLAHQYPDSVRILEDDTSSSMLVSGDLIIDLQKRQIKLNGKSVFFTAVEFDIISYLASYQGHVFSHRQIYEAVFKSIHELAITDSHILVGGALAEQDGGSRVVVYDYDGNQLLMLGSNDISQPDCIGHITGLAETENGFVAADGNMRDLYFWTKEGTFVGAISMGDLLGTSYPWIEDMQLLDDGSLLLALTQEREDKSSYELLFFRLTGF